MSHEAGGGRARGKEQHTLVASTIYERLRGLKSRAPRELARFPLDRMYLRADLVAHNHPRQDARAHMVLGEARDVVLEREERRGREEPRLPPPAAEPVPQPTGPADDLA